MNTMKRLALVAAVAVLTSSAPVFAQAAQEEGGARAAQEAGEHEAEPTGIVNWFSWDYGPNAKDPTHKHWPPPFFYALVNFAAFALIMGRLAWKPLKSFVKERHDQIAQNLAESAKLRGEAEAQLKQYQAKIAGIDGEIEQLLKQIREEAERDKARIIAAAEEQARRLKHEAQQQIEAEIDRARRELRKNVIEAAITAADATLKQAVGAEDQRKMAERYVSDFEQSAKAHTGRPS
jgi:ATP synthase F0 subunit b